MSTTYILSWDMYGLESCINLTEIEHNRVIEILASPDGRTTSNSYSSSKMLGHLLLRAKANNQRHYEIYTIEVDPSISKDDLVNWFHETPQEAADLVRSRGIKIHSDRLEDNRRLIR